jgi:hypothetical protein
MSRSHLFSCRPLAALAGALTLLCGSAAGAASISGLSIAINPANTANFEDDAGTEAGQVLSAVNTVSSTGSAFMTRYSAGVFTDSGGGGAADNTVVLNASYTITFNVTNAASQIWQITVDTSRVGARTSIDDGNGSSAFDLTAVVGSLSGPGSITAGSLALAAIANSTQSTTVDLPFNQTGQATIQGVGNGTVSMTFTFTATATSDVQGNAGDEAAIRMGQEETLDQFDAGQYPGTGGRTQANDGHFVSAVITQIGVVPEPDTALLLALGLMGVALQSRRALKRGA